MKHNFVAWPDTDDPPSQMCVRAAAFNRLSAGAVVLDGHGVILDANESWRLFTHLNQGDVATTGHGVSYLEVCDRSAAAGVEGAAEVAAGLRQILTGERDRFDLEYPCPSPIEDRWFLLQASAAPVADGSGAVVQHVDITTKKLAADAMTALADNDALTGLPNRRSALRYLEQQLDSSAATRSPVSVLFVDLDGFKAVNDQHGHHVGDELLVKIAVRLRRVLREQDRLCRLGGDEFVLICPGLDQTAAMLVAHRLRTVMSAPFQIEDLEVVASASVGVAVSTADSSVEELINSADSAMYLDKRGTTRRRDLGRMVAKPSASIPWPAEPLPSITASLASSNDESELATALTGLQARAEASFAHQTTHDWLTQLPNVASLHASLHDAFSTAGSDLNVALAVFDMDDFRLVNDRNGHTIGDATLRGLADRLVIGLAHGDLIARLDGDGFAVVRTNMSSYGDARQLGDAILSVLRKPLTVGEQGIQVGLSASVGVALSTASDSSASLLRDADDAMRHAKTSGKGRVTVFDAAARSRAHRRRTLTTSLPLALERGELHLEYQPVLDLASLDTVGFEALLRWQHPDLGAISPLEFIPLAETGGEILPIGDWVVEQAAQQLTAWRADPRTPEHLWIAVNISATQLAQPLFAERVVAAVRNADSPLAAIHLEITESVLVDHVDHALQTIEELHSAGFNVSIDDFGTGYSSLSYLSRMPVDTLKIDRAFVDGLNESGPAASIIRTITTLANSLDLATVAEGIESPLQLKRLEQLGCRYGQGFLWSAGFCPEDALAWMIERSTQEHVSAC